MNTAAEKNKQGSTSVAREREARVWAWGLIAILVIAALLSIAGCDVPNMSALAYSYDSGTSGSMELELIDLPERLGLSGEYQVDDGSLTVTVYEPNGTIAFAKTWDRGSRGQVTEPLVPEVGTWRMTVMSADGRGSYNLQLRY